MRISSNARLVILALILGDRRVSVLRRSLTQCDRY
jgi:hypothetical protein